MPVVLLIKVIPQSGRQQVVWDQKAGILKAFLKSAPEKNKANDELISFLRKILGTPPNAIVIIGGQAARRKKVAVTTTLTQEQVLMALGAAGQQQSLW